MRPELHIKFVLNHFKDRQGEVGAVILNCLWSSTRKRYTSTMLHSVACNLCKFRSCLHLFPQVDKRIKAAE